MVLARWAKDLNEKMVLPNKERYEEICPDLGRLFKK